MLVKNVGETKKNIDKLFSKNSSFKRNESLTHVVRKILTQKKELLALSKKYPTPFYIFDKKGLEAGIRAFKLAFQDKVPTMYIYYAMKANPHPLVLSRVVKEGLGIDVSSGRELEIALKEKPKSIIFTGPAKKMWELELAIKHSDKVTINIDSQTELKKLIQLSQKHKKHLKIGVRIVTKVHGTWNKFGVLLPELSILWQGIKKTKYLRPVGIQTHMSFNETSKSYEVVITEIGSYLKKHKEILEDLLYIDLGGGFLPYKTQGMHPWEDSLGLVSQIANNYFGPQKSYGVTHIPLPSISLEKYAEGIGHAIKKHLSFYKGAFFFEPGRVIVNSAMHVALTIEDIKKKNVAITDGATNMIGWERFEYDYFPVINLTHPSLSEKPFTIFGSLCTPNDVWGFYIHAKKVAEGDVVLIPYQGAYTFTYAQNFIKEIPPVYSL